MLHLVVRSMQLMLKQSHFRVPANPGFERNIPR